MARKHGFQDSAYVAGYMKAIEETSAPKLLEALIACQEDFFNGNIGNSPSTETREKIRNAIKKATN